LLNLTPRDQIGYPLAESGEADSVTAMQWLHDDARDARSDEAVAQPEREVQQ
jgi:hypothetical protein